MSSSLGKRVLPVGKFFEKGAVLEVDHNGIVFHIPLFANAVDKLIVRERPTGFQYVAEDVFDHARAVSPLGEGVESSAHKYEAGVFDELVVAGCHMRGALEERLNRLGDLAEVHRGAMALHRKVREIADAFCAHIGTCRESPLSERILSEHF